MSRPVRRSALSGGLTAGLAAVTVLAGLTGCSRHTVVTTTTSTTTIERTQTLTHSPAPGSAATGAVAAGPTTSADGPCPFIDKQTAADQEGNRIGRIAVLSAAGHPVGCQFFFDPNWGYPRMTMQITSETYRTSTDAYNAMVRTGEAAGTVEPVHDLVPGVDAVLYQTAFYPPDGNRDWACTFAKGTRVVTVKTDQNDTSQDARNVAQTIAGRF